MLNKLFCTDKYYKDKVKPGSRLEIPYVFVNCQIMLGTGYPFTSQSNTTGFPI